MKVYILLILFFNFIESTNIPETFNNIYNPLSSYITPGNELVIYNPNNISLVKYELMSKSPYYINWSYLMTREFPKNSSENISDIHFHFNYINTSTINITYFNEKYTSHYVYNANTPNMTYKHISLEVKEKNKLILFLYPTNNTYNSSINIVEFDYKSEEKLKIIKTYSFQSNKENINCYCVSVSANKDDILCGLIELERLGVVKYSIPSYVDTFTYSLIYFSESASFPNKTNIKNYTISSLGTGTGVDSKTGFFVENFIKLFPLSEGKTIFCFDERNSSSGYTSSGKVKCGLAQVQNNKIKINDQKYLTSNNINRGSNDKYLNKNILDGVKINDQQIILSYYEYKSKSYYQIISNIYFIKTTIINDKLSLEGVYAQFTSSSSTSTGFYSLYLLKDNDDNIVSIRIFNDIAAFVVYGYINCTNSSIYLYNGEKNSHISFSYKSIFENNDIIFLNKNNQSIHSIIDENSKPINYSVIYNKKGISYNYNPEDYNYIKNNNINLYYTASLNENKSQTCQLTINFHPCQKECDLCTIEKCYDKNLKVVIIPTDLEKYFFILPLSILAMLIVLIFFTFAKCCVKEPLPNYGGNLIQNEMPLIQS